MWFLFAVLAGPRRPHSELGEEEIQKLVRSARSGDSGAAGRLYSDLVTPVFRAVRPLCDSESDTEDVVQDAFIKAFDSLHRYTHRPGTRFIAWVVTIALNDARKSGRRSHRRLELVKQEYETHPPGNVETPEEVAFETQRKEQLLAVLGKLTERDREVVSLRYGAELEVDEVARLCGITSPNVRKICQRQRQRLLELLRDESSGTEQAQTEMRDG
jgi:RNA polymerase sigma-70 factor (ECF subfamily)